MADEVQLNVTGVKEAVAYLEELPKNIVVLGFLRALDAAGAVIQDALFENTPVRTEVRSTQSAARTGLQAGGRVITGGELREALTRKITIDTNYQGGVVEVYHGKLAWVANLVEYGHRLVGHKPGKKDLGTVPAHPFIRPTAEAVAQEAVDAFEASIVDTVNTFGGQKTA